MLSLSKGQLGRFKESGIEFEVMDTSQSAVTGIRYRWERETRYLSDGDLKAAADDIPEWGAGERKGAVS